MPAYVLNLSRSYPRTSPKQDRRTCRNDSSFGVVQEVRSKYWVGKAALQNRGSYLTRATIDIGSSTTSSTFLSCRLWVAPQIMFTYSRLSRVFQSWHFRLPQRTKYQFAENGMGIRKRSLLKFHQHHIRIRMEDFLRLQNQKCTGF